MNPDDKKKFFEYLRDEFAPELRKIGFKGSGRHFRRINGEIINAVWIQGDKYGKGCAVNLGLHLTFLPVSWQDELPDILKVKEIDCEFRTRLSPKNKGDYWWKYGGLLHSPSKSARHLIQTYLDWGEPLFKSYASVDEIGKMFTPAQLRDGNYFEGFGGTTMPRIALVLARIQLHLDNRAMAREYALLGIERLGRAVVLKKSLENILDATD